MLKNLTNKLFMRLCGDVFLPPFADEIPIDYKEFKTKSALSIYWRKLRPNLNLLIRGQYALQEQVIDQNHRRILWIYKGIPQVGDALMDLSSRIFLKNSDKKLDLYTDAHLAELFQADDVFERVFTRIEDAKMNDYDLVIVDSFKWRCLQEKIKFFPAIPFVTMRGYFSGPEFNRTLFSFFRMRQLLRSNETTAQIIEKASPYLCSTNEDKQIVKEILIPTNTIAFAIGGASPSRTYLNWDRVINKLLSEHANISVVLLGSSNADAMRKKILKTLPNKEKQILDCVDQFSLRQTFQIMQRCRLVVCADGGLLHLANAANIPTVSLFDKHVKATMRLTAANRSISLEAQTEISALSDDVIVCAIKQSLLDQDTQHSHLANSMMSIPINAP